MFWSCAFCIPNIWSSFETVFQECMINNPVVGCEIKHMAGIRASCNMLMHLCRSIPLLWQLHLRSISIGCWQVINCFREVPGLKSNLLLRRKGFCKWLSGKESACNAGDVGSIPGSGRSPGEGNGNSLHYSWRIPWTEEPGGLWSMGCKRARHDLVTKQQLRRKVESPWENNMTVKEKLAKKN